MMNQLRLPQTQVSVTHLHTGNTANTGNTGNVTGSSSNWTQVNVTQCVFVASKFVIHSQIFDIFGV